MDDRTVSFDELVDLDWPIRLRRVDKKPFLFYLAGKVPLSVTDLASECSQNEAQIKKILNRRFKGEIQIDQTGFLTLTDAARSPVVSYGKQFISQAKNERNQAAELREDEQIEAAGARYFHAAKLLAGVRKRFAAVNYVPDQLDASIERLEEKADNMRKEHAKGVYKHRNLLSNQREEEGDEALQNDEYDVAETKFRKARDALQEALDEVSTYNDTRLSAESPRLRTDSLEDRLEALQRKYAYAGERQTAEPTDTKQSDSGTEDDAADGTPATDSDPDVPSKQALLDAIEDLAQQLRKAPTTTEMKEQGRFEPHQYYDAFGSWKEALEQTALTIRSDLISDLRRVADELDKRPTQSDMDEHGRYDGHRYKQYFETWEEALEAADIEEPTSEELIAEIQRLDREHARIPSTNLMRDEGKYSPQIIRDQFGSWDDALEAAGIDKRQRLIDELKRVDAECDERPTTTIASDISIYSPTYFSNEFGSWSDALEAAGITTQHSGRNSGTTREDTTDDEPTDEELIAEIERLDEKSDKIPTAPSMRKEGQYGPEIYYDRFGGWDEALDAAGIDKRKRLITELRRIDEECTGRPSSYTINNRSKYNSGYFTDEFGTWEAALEAAGITDESGSEATPEATGEGSSTDGNDPTDEELLEEIRLLEQQLGHVPSPNTIRFRTTYSIDDYRTRFGSWNEALAAAGLANEPDSTESDPADGDSSGDDTSPTDEELFEEIHRLDRQYERIPLTTRMRKEGQYSPQQYYNRFGSWDDALEAAGINKRERLIAELKRLDKRSDGRLTSTFFEEHSEYDSGYIVNVFGSWDEALDAAGITPDAASDRSSAKREPATSKDLNEGTIHPNKLAELYESLRVLNKVLIEYIDATPNLHLGADEPIANWQSAIEDVAVGDGISDDVPCLGALHADRNPFSMNEYREQYGNGDRITEFQALAVAEMGAKEYNQLVETSDSKPPRPRLPLVPGNGKPLPALLSSEPQLSQALELLEELLTTTLDIDTVEPPALTASQPDSEPTTISTSSTPAGTDSDTDPLTLADVEPNETHDGPLVGRLTGYIANPSGEATSQLHFKDIAGEDFWLYITDHDVDHECEKGNWYFISQFRGPKELGGGRGDQALRSTSQLSLENHGTSLPPTIDADVSEPASLQTQSPSSTQTTSRTASSDGQTTTSSTNSASDNDRSDSEPDEETDPMVDDLLGDMEDEGLL